MNGGLFSLLKFSSGYGGKESFRSVSFIEGVTGSLGIGRIIPRNFTLSERCNALIMVINFVPRTVKLEENVESLLRLHLSVTRKIIINEACNCACNCVRIISKKREYYENISGKVHISKVLSRVFSLDEILNATLALGIIYIRGLHFLEVVSGFFCVTSYTIHTLVIETPLKPGGELRINSEAFEVLLNGESVLHTHTGDWIDLTRDTLDLIVDAGADSQTSGALIYTERFL